MKTPDDLRPPSSIYSHPYKSLYKQTGYKIFVQNLEMQFSTLNGPSTIPLHAIRIIGNDRPLINCVNRIFCNHLSSNQGPKGSKKTPDDQRPPSSIHSHSYKFLYKQTEYEKLAQNLEMRLSTPIGPSILPLHAIRTAGTKKIF